MTRRIIALAVIIAAALSAALIAPDAAYAAGEAAEEYVRLAPGVTAEQMSADYWLSRKNKQAVRADKLIMTEAEIADFNRANAKQICIGGESYALTDIPDAVPGSVVRALIENHALPDDPASRYVNGQATDSAYWDALAANMAEDAIGESVTVRFGYSVRRASLRSFPTNDFAGSTPTDKLYDKLVMSEFMPYLPLAVLHESADGEWYYVLLYGFGGWVEKKNVALCCDRAGWEARMSPEEFLTVTGRELRLAEEPYAPQISALSLPMGTKLPLVRASDAPTTVNARRNYGCYVVKLPVRGDDGYIRDEYALVPVTEDVTVGCLPFTAENELRLAFRLLGDRYGWAGMYGANDCSGIVHEIFACFGFTLPRTAEAIMHVDGWEYLDLAAGSDDDKLKVLADIPAGSLLAFPGHIMLYLGRVGDRAYVISAVGSFAEPGKTDYAVNSVTVNSLADTVRRSGKTWLASLDGALVCKYR